MEYDITRLRKQMAFLLEIDKEKLIGRQTYLSDGSRKENDAEHAWHMAIMAYVLKDYSPEPVDPLKAVIMLLIHDIVEIDAGDTYAYDSAAAQSQSEREEKAADRIFGLLPEDQGLELRALWEEFEAKETPEARFAAALDRIQPTMLTAAEGGTSWKEHGIALSNVLRRNEITTKCPQLWNYSLNNYIAPLVKEGALTDDVPIPET